LNIEQVLFGAFAVFTLFSAALVIFAKSPVSSAMALVSTFFFLAGIYVLLWAHTVAALQVLVYAGAIMVLFLFVIMLLNLGHDYQSDLRGGAWAVFAFLLSGVLAGVLALQVRGGDADLGGSFAGGEAIDAALAEHGAVGALALPLFREYVVPFEITGILLLVAIVGALVLAKREV
jgi:NADH-quinone oxidoreductase subunit J